MKFYFMMILLPVCIRILCNLYNCNCDISCYGSLRLLVFQLLKLFFFSFQDHVNTNIFLSSYHLYHPIIETFKQIFHMSVIHIEFSTIVEPYTSK